MKCIRCKRNHKYRNGMTCRCGYHFVFDPKTDGMTDSRFEFLINKASANDTYFFTFNQFYSVYCEKISGMSLLKLAFYLGLLVLFLATLPFSLIVWLVMKLPPLRRKFDRYSHSLGSTMPVEKVRKHTDQWLDQGGKIRRLIESPTLDVQPPKWTEPDIYDYGVEGILFVEHDRLVDLLVKNGFHTENRVLVVSEHGYPKYLMPQVWELIEQRPDLMVYLLHDSTPQGMAMQERVLANHAARLSGHPIVDLGLSPETVQRLQRLKHLRPAKQNYAIPVDYLKYGALALGLSQAIAKNMNLSASLQQDSQHRWSDGGDGGTGDGTMIGVGSFAWFAIADGDDGGDGDFG